MRDSRGVRRYYAAMADPSSECSILGTGTTEQTTRDDAVVNAQDVPVYGVAVISESIYRRIQRDGSTPELAAECFES